MAGIKNATRMRSEGRPFGPDNPPPGRPKGSKNKLSAERIRSAQELFAPLVPVVIKRIKAHLQRHNSADKDCATCRHHMTLVLEYSFGKPLQRHEVDIDAVRNEARRLARELGIDEEQAVREAEAILRGED